MMSEKLKEELPHYAVNCLKIRSKAGKIVPFRFNRVQEYIHGQLEAQKRFIGKVRALTLKGRQQGCSSYVAARFYQQVSQVQGLQVFILTHERPATQNLFEIVNRFYENSRKEIRPKRSVANITAMYFPELDSGYKVATARVRGVGRSATFQCLHGSEVAFWPFAASHMAGAMQAVPPEDGTEIILESTANGVGNFFHQTWRKAEAGGNEYIAIFVPWHWQEEYRKPPPRGFALDEDERNYAILYRLDLEQMAWRRAKIAELKDPALFAQEYPACAAEAFQMSGHDSFIPAPLVALARKAQCEASGPLVIGFDPAWMGGDRHAMAWRQGRRVIKTEKPRPARHHAGGRLGQAGARCRQAQAHVHRRRRGRGRGVRPAERDGLRRRRAPGQFRLGAALPPAARRAWPSERRSCNRRAEMWLAAKEWLADPAGAQIPDSDSLQADACAPGYRYDSTTRLVLERKEDMRRRSQPSPDEWDAVALTFAEPVAASANFNRRVEYPKRGLA
jgi:hypothetical protein